MSAVECLPDLIAESSLDGIGVLAVWTFLRVLVTDVPPFGEPLFLVVDGLLVLAAGCFVAVVAGYRIELPWPQSWFGVAGSLLALTGGIALGVDAALGMAASDGWGAVALVAGSVVAVLVVIPLVVGGAARLLERG